MCKTLLGFAHFHRHRRHEPKQQNRTLHLLQKPDIFICYRHVFPTISLTFHAFALRIEPQLLVSRHPGHMKHGSTTHQLVRHKNALRSEDA